MLPVQESIARVGRWGRTVAVVAICAACGGSSGNPSPTPPPAVDSRTSTFTATPAVSAADGVSPVQLTSTARDASGAPLSGRTVAFSTIAPGWRFSAATSTTDSSGQASTTLTATQAGQAQVSAAIDGVTLAAQVSFLDISHVGANPPISVLPATWRLGPFMEIYVRAYRDSNGDGRGDFRGVTQSLDYLHDLGITGLWLMPVNASEDHDHGYAVVDYRGLEADYGTQPDLDELLAQAHARGIGVILDYVINHSAAQNPFFLDSSSSTSGRFRDWYVWSSTHPAGWIVLGGDPWRLSTTGYYYAPFWDQMPDFNLRNVEVVEYHHDNARYWLNRGVDGFRFDAVGMLVEDGPTAWSDQPENYQLMGDVRAVVSGYPSGFMVCEDPGSSMAADACGAAFAFGHATDVIGAARADPTSIQAVGAFFSGQAPGTTLQQATFLANHDSFTGGRLEDQFGGDEAQYRLAAATYLLQPGTPFLYYGEEIGMAGAAALGGDWSIRTPMSWTADAATAGFTTGVPFRHLSDNVSTHNVASEQVQPDSLLAWYKKLIALRRSLPSLAAGSYESPLVTGSVLAFRRSLATEHSLVIINYGTAQASPTLDGLPAGATLTARLPPGGADVVVGAGGTATFPIAAQSVLLYTYAR